MIVYDRKECEYIVADYITSAEIDDLAEDIESCIYKFGYDAGINKSALMILMFDIIEILYDHLQQEGE